MLRKSMLGAAGLLGLVGAFGFHGCSAENGHLTGENQVEEGVGSVGLALTLPNGTSLNTLRYTVTGGPSSITRSADVDVSSSTQLRFQLVNLPVGGGYTITLGATTSDGESCMGSATFSIADNKTTNLAMSLVCGAGISFEEDNQGDLRVSVDVVVNPSLACPVVTGISALPLEVIVGGSIALEGSASSSAGVSYAWSGEGGSFAAGSAAATSFTCSAPGEHALALTVQKSGCDARSQDVTVTCTATPTFSSAPAYLVPLANGVTIRALLTAGDASGVKPDGTPYRMVGIPDGMGAYDNGDGTTFSMVVNHELGNGAGIARAHGSNGTFVSRWRVRKSDLAVLGGEDLIRSVNVWSRSASAYHVGTNVNMGRFCSADLAPATAFYNAATGLGFDGQLFTNGEETGNEGRVFAHGLDGVSYELPRHGKASWENVVPSPYAQDKTISIGIDDSTPGELYVYVGTKTGSGSPVERAGLTNGTLYGVSVTGFATEPQAGGIPSGPFTLAGLGNVENMTGSAIQAASIAAGVTRFNRPEDGAWDPSAPSDFYFVTTNSATAPSRLFRLRFQDITQPELGGTIDMLLDGSEGQVMLDNLALDARGHIMLTEDPGGNARLARVYRYTIATDELVEVAQHNPELFTSGAPGFITQDEEASGIIDASDLIGPGHWLLTDQIHAGQPGEIVERGQIQVLYDPGTR